MEKIFNGKLNLMKLAGTVFAIIGAVLALVGFGLYFALKSANTELYWLPTVILCGVGLIFLILGAVFLIRSRRKQEMERELKERGEAIYAEVTGVSLNYSVSLNGRHPYFVEACYRDPDSGEIHMFRSHDLQYDPTKFIKDQKVPVYCRGDDYKHYYMDIDAIARL